MKDPDTRQRVLEAAGEIFAEKGYKEATIREIVDRAGANLNAVNYYFRDKRGLYRALFEEADRDQENLNAIRQISDSTLPPAEQLRAFIDHFVRTVMARKNIPWQRSIMAREMVEPTELLDEVVDTYVRPRFEAIVSIVRKILPQGMPERQTRLCAESVIAQCVHIVHCRTVVVRLIPDLDFSTGCLDALVDHITRFSLLALENMSSPTEQSPPA